MGKFAVSLLALVLVGCNRNSVKTTGFYLYESITSDWKGAVNLSQDGEELPTAGRLRIDQGSRAEEISYSGTTIMNIAMNYGKAKRIELKNVERCTNHWTSLASHRPVSCTPKPFAKGSIISVL